MARFQHSALFWTPRALALLYALFISLFALDVFSEGYRLGELLIALFMHLVPTILILVAMLIAWHWERVGAFLFIALAIGYVVMAWGKMELLTYVIIAGPAALIALLFWVGTTIKGR